MAELPEGTDRGRLVIVREKDVPDAPELTVGAAWLQNEPDTFEFLRFDGETPEQAEAREEAAAAAAEPAPAPKSETKQPPAPPRTGGDF
jgi:hypothetical protein